MTSSSPRALRRLDSPLGRIELTGDGESVTSLSIENASGLPHDALPESSDAVLDDAARQLAEYFVGTRREFEIPVALVGTEFQRAIWAQLRELPWGTVASYGELGLGTGRATAGRAVGGAVGANPVPLIVPCHRVLGVDGRITGYSAGAGIPTKAWLLRHEGIPHSVAGDSAAPTLDLELA